ncbi:Leucine-rich repeat family protein [Perilla frutescens var. frutescens]|nr:Leucine-rich repeat family protein [Perilla frutescens var. frutescens]
MTALSSKKILQEKNTSDPNSITSLTLTHKALSDVSCLGEFKNLERLDLGFNNLTSLEGLKSCRNLKWLSVIQNKLQSLKGIDGLSRLTVLNAGKNKIKSMDELKSLSSLRALILNDNEIISVCKLDQMKELNTLVLSRNPISSLGESLVKVKSITKLSLSNCQLQKVDSSLRSCLELKELRLAHNEIMTIPSEFGNFVKLQNLDLGNNLIANWSNLKVLSSLVDLTNLNLQGNPIAEKENLLKKVKKLLPNLHVFNARPIDKIAAKEVHEKAADFSVEAGNKLNRRNKNSSTAYPSDNVEITNISDKRMKKKLKLQQDTPSEFDVKSDAVGKGKDIDKKSSKMTKEGRVNIIDSAEAPFMDPYVTGASEDPSDAADKKLDRKIDQAIDAVSVLVTYPTKKKNKRKHAVDPAMLEVSQVDEIGLGGTSAWDA